MAKETFRKIGSRKGPISERRKNIPDDLVIYNFNETMEILNKTYVPMKKLVRSGKIRFTRSGNTENARYIFTLADIRAYIKEPNAIKMTKKELDKVFEKDGTKDSYFGKPIKKK